MLLLAEVAKMKGWCVDHRGISGNYTLDFVMCELGSSDCMDKESSYPSSGWVSETGSQSLFKSVKLGGIQACDS